MSETQTATKGPSPEHERLGAFVGKWIANGKSYHVAQSVENPYGSPAVWISEETYEWFPGGYFLVHRFDAKAGDIDFKGIEILGYDSARGSYFTHFFENYGFHPTFQARVNGREWSFEEASSRAKILFGEDGRTMTVAWEWKPDGVHWLPLCDRTATKVS